MALLLASICPRFVAWCIVTIHPSDGPRFDVFLNNVKLSNLCPSEEVTETITIVSNWISRYLRLGTFHFNHYRRQENTVSGNKACMRTGRSFIFCFLRTRDKHGKFSVSKIYIFGMT